MATAKWAAPSAQGANIAGATLDSLPNGSTSAFISHDNSANLDLYASISLALGSLTPTANGYITLRVFALSGTDVPTNTGAVGGGEAYTLPLNASGPATQQLNFPMVRLYPEGMRFCFTNGAGVALPATGNSVKVRPYNEAVA